MFISVCDELTGKRGNNQNIDFFLSGKLSDVADAQLNLTDSSFCCQ